ncbi:MAG: proline dehydrogenase family protein [Bacteroidales bacterium]|nr:proline dehydrogenase family protein [Bacteroidales bacterium]
MNIDFKNTEVAFISKSDKDLKKAKFLYKVMASPFVTKAAKVLTQFAMSIRFPVNWIVKPTIYNLFVGGETIDECTDSVKVLSKHNVKAILDYSVEGKESIEDINKAMEETLNSIKNAGNNSNIPFAVFKPTAFTTSNVLTKVSAGEELTEEEKKEAQNFKDRVNKLCKAAFDLDIPILIDAEDSWYQKFIDETTEEMMQLYNKEKAIVYNTWQMYRKDRLEHLEQTYKKAVEGDYFLGAKFVRGAYMEKERERAEKMGYESPICDDKDATDKSYNDALRYSFEHRDVISIFNGTHNDESTLLLAELMEKENIDKDDKRFWFSQLYGMSDNISFNMAKAGYNVAKYLPFGPVKHVLPYLFRRAEENTSVKGQTSRELALIATEIKRRKTK